MRTVGTGGVQSYHFVEGDGAVGKRYGSEDHTNCVVTKSPAD